MATIAIESAVEDALCTVLEAAIPSTTAKCFKAFSGDAITEPCVVILARQSDAAFDVQPSLEVARVVTVDIGIRSHSEINPDDPNEDPREWHQRLVGLVLTALYDGSFKTALQAAAPSGSGLKIHDYQITGRSRAPVDNSLQTIQTVEIAANASAT